MFTTLCCYSFKVFSQCMVNCTDIPSQDVEYEPLSTCNMSIKQVFRSCLYLKYCIIQTMVGK